MTLREPDVFIEAYGLGRPVSFELIHDGIDNRAYIVNTVEGKKVVLRENKKPYIDKSIDFEVSLLNMLKKNDFPAARIMKTKDGRSYLSNKHSHIIIFEYIDGIQFQEVKEDMLPRGTIFTGGRSLGSLHKITLGQGSDEPSKRDIFTEIDRFLLTADDLTGIEGHEDLRDHVISFKKEALNRIKDKKTLMGIIHNDFRIQNLIFDGNGDCSIIDFDWSCYGPLLKDVGLAIAEWSIFDFEVGPSRKAIDEFISGYNATSPNKISYGRDLLFWICFACISDACTFFTDLSEGSYEGKTITKTSQCRMYKKFICFLKEIS